MTTEKKVEKLGITPDPLSLENFDSSEFKMLKSVMPNKSETSSGFLRTKKVKGRLYWYLVRSERVNGRIKQVVLKYFGSHQPTEKEVEEVLKEERLE
jgi:hypothetical protein